MENTDDQSTAINLHSYTKYNITYEVGEFKLEIEQSDFVIGMVMHFSILLVFHKSYGQFGKKDDKK